ncbi:Lrp/AsnC family transcriptional regulator [Gandjariella thermophila]|nr:Lrp/AsnC family transcriptional regulator [Gandjariella thermophila]
MAKHGPPRARRQVVLDDTARRIIDELRADGRRPYAAIGNAVGLSEAAVRQRVQRLVDSGLLRIVAVVDQDRLGHTRRALVGVRVEGDVDAVAAALTELDEVSRVLFTTGSFDVLAEVACRDDEHLLDLLGKHIRRLPGVVVTETFVVLGESGPGARHGPA